MKLTDDMLYQYASEARDMWLATLPQREEVPEHTFSRRFQRKMKRLLKQQRRTPRMRKVIRYARIAAIFIFVLVAAAFFNPTIAEASWESVVEIFTKISDGVIHFRYSSDASFEESSFPEAYFTYFPDGMEEDREDRIEDITFRHRRYLNTAGEEINIFEELIYSNSMTFTGYDQNNPTLEFFSIGSEQAAAFIEDGKTTISWIQKNVLYTLVTNLPMETTKKIAKGLKQKPVPASSRKEQPSEKSSEEEEPRWGGDPNKGFELSDYTTYGLMSEKEKEEKIKEFGLDFSEKDIEAGKAIAQQYYKDLSERQRDPALFYPEELEELKKIDGWLKQGVEIIYDEQRALHETIASFYYEQVEQDGAGTLMILLAIVPAAPQESIWRSRVIYLHRENMHSDWSVQTEGWYGVV